MLSRLLLKCARNINQSHSLSVDLTRYLSKADGWEKDCNKLVQNLFRCGFFYAYDPRVDHSKNDRLLDQMECYFALRSRQFEEGMTNLDVCVGNVKVGLRENFTQLRDQYVEQKNKLQSDNVAITPIHPKVDPTWRYHWLLNSNKNIKPIDFPNFPTILESWGQEIQQTTFTTCEMIAVGLGLDSDAISSTCLNGTHYVSPPGVDLAKSKPGDVITGFHRDFGLITIQGKTRYPGLMAWLLTGEKVDINLPEDHLLVQGGKQLEVLTGGYLKAGFHEVIHTSAVEAQVKHNLKAGKSTWRVVTSLFSHVQGNLTLQPLNKFKNESSEKVYPAMRADDYIMNELSEDAKRKYKYK